LGSAAYGILVLSEFASSTLFSALAVTTAWRGVVALLFATSVLMFVARLATTLWLGFALHAALTWLLWSSPSSSLRTTPTCSCCSTSRRS